MEACLIIERVNAYCYKLNNYNFNLSIDCLDTVFNMHSANLYLIVWREVMGAMYDE